MEKQAAGLLVNLAILKVNWDERRDIIHNFMPLIGYAISLMDDTTITVPDLKKKIIEVAQFDIAGGALETMIRRAAKPPYNYVENVNRIFRKTVSSQQKISFISDRDAASESFSVLEESYHKFCQKNYPDLPLPDSGQQFFSMLSDVAPHIIASASQYLSVNEVEDPKDFDLRYRTARFIQRTIDDATDDLDALQSYFQGAVLAESFYYTSPESVRSKFRDVKIYYDTDILSKILGFTSKSEADHALELHQMIEKAGARTYIFDHTYEELVGIIEAARHQRKSGPIVSDRPDDIFSYLSGRSSTLSDIELILATLDSKISGLGIRIEGAPPYTSELGIQENVLLEYLGHEIYYSNPVARDRDVRSLSAIFRIRAGLVKKSLESCRAIFVTKNSGLARASTKFFNENYGVSDAPICITDYVFGMLVWLKTTDKRAQIPPNLLVANALAALKPNDILWGKYISEVERLKSNGEIDENSYNLLAHSLEARQALMEVTDGDYSAFVVGSVSDVLEMARSEILRDAASTIKKYEENISSLTDEKRSADGVAENMQSSLTKWVFRGISTIFLMITIGLISRLQLVSPWENFGSWQAMSKLQGQEIALNIVALGFVVLGAVNLIFGWSFNPWLRSISKWVAQKLLGSKL
jgi:hypothetical protein